MVFGRFTIATLCYDKFLVFSFVMREYFTFLRSFGLTDFGDVS